MHLRSKHGSTKQGNTLPHLYYSCGLWKMEQSGWQHAEGGLKADPLMATRVGRKFQVGKCLLRGLEGVKGEDATERKWEIVSDSGLIVLRQKN